MLEDSSFVVATIDPNDKFHTDAVFIFNRLISAGNEIKVIVPSIVFFESVFTLIKNGIDRKVVENKLWNFLYKDQILNVALIETMAFKLARQLSIPQLANLRTADYFISSVGFQYEAQILTFDYKMYGKIKPIYPSIYYCSGIDGKTDESIEFLQELADTINRQDLVPTPLN